MEKEINVTLFEGKAIRKTWHNAQWFFSIVDIITILTNSSKPRTYWAMLKKREPQLLTICEQLKMQAADNKFYKTDAAHTEGVLRLIQSVPSPKAEPFKMWLASLGKQAIDEAIDPELGYERLNELYRAKGYSEEWISRRLQTIDIRKQLTDEWKNRGVKEGQEYSILTATIAKGTFGLFPSEHSKLKDLKKQNLRDHMTPLELIFTALSEETTRLFAIRDEAEGFDENYDVAQKSGNMTGDARRNYEQKTGLKVVSSENFLALDKSDKPKELQTDDKTESDVVPK